VTVSFVEMFGPEPSGLSIDELAAMVRAQADMIFPHRTDVSMFLKLYSEIGEMIDADGAADECADVAIMLLDYVNRKGVNLEEAVLNKMAVNAKRQWLVDKNGVMRHVE
jgi:hypothetical protein